MAERPNAFDARKLVQTMEYVMKSKEYTKPVQSVSHNKYYPSDLGITEIVDLFRVRKLEILGDLIGCISIFLILYISLTFGCALDAACYQAQGGLQ